MIYDSKICTRGSFLEVVPLGLLCTLQYNDKGILNNIWPSLEPSNNSNSDNILDNPLSRDITISLEKAKVVPQRIHLPSSGPTIVKGVLYSSKEFFNEGRLPDVIYDDMISDMKQNPEDYQFYAGDIRNSSLRFNGAIAIRNRLEVLGFKLIPGYSITEDFTDTTFLRMLRSNKYPFIVPLFAGYMIFIDGKMTFHDVKFRQFTVEKVKSYPDKNGYIMADIYSNSNILECTISYTDVVKYNVQKGTSVVLDSNNGVILGRSTDANSRIKVSSDINCSICGKAIKVMSKGYTVCNDPHCQSKIYPDIIHFCNVLGLDVLNFEDFTKYIKNKSIICLTDILDLDEYRDAKIKCTIGSLLSAIIPVSVCSDSSVIHELVVRAGSLEALDYYIKNPDEIYNDLKLNIPKIVKWLSDDYNVNIYEVLVNDSDRIEIDEPEKQFSGAPIFRNKVICITGKFKCGNYETVTGILKSYSAEVVTNFSNRTDAVLVGHFRNEDDTIISLAKAYGKPIYKETEFFNAYEISKDIGQ